MVRYRPYSMYRAWNDYIIPSFTFPITVQVLNNGRFDYCVNMAGPSSYWRANNCYSHHFQGSYLCHLSMYVYVYSMYFELPSHCCRCFFTSHYIKLCQPTCQLYCKLLTDCGFIGHKVCRNCHKTYNCIAWSLTWESRFLVWYCFNFQRPNYDVIFYFFLSSTVLLRCIFHQN